MTSTCFAQFASTLFQSLCPLHSLEVSSVPEEGHTDRLPFSSRRVEPAGVGVGRLAWRAGDEAVQAERGVRSSAVLGHLLRRIPADAAVF